MTNGIHSFKINLWNANIPLEMTKVFLLGCTYMNKGLSLLFEKWKICSEKWIVRKFPEKFILVFFFSLQCSLGSSIVCIIKREFNLRQESKFKKNIFSNLSPSYPQMIYDILWRIVRWMNDDVCNAESRQCKMWHC